MINFNPIYSRPDGSYVAMVNGLPYHIIDGDPLKAEVESYLANHPEALILEPTPPEPTKAELKAIARNARDSALRDIIDRYNAPRWEAMTESERQVVRDYRQALLDWPESAGFPDISTLPVLPNA